MGRPAKDYEGLFHQFVTTQLSRAEFLRLKGFNPNSGSSYVNTSDWETRRLQLAFNAEPSVFIDEPTPRELISQTISTLADPNASPGIVIELSMQLASQIQRLLLSASEESTLGVQDIVRLTEAVVQLQMVQRRSAGLSSVGSIARVDTDNGKADHAKQKTPTPPVYFNPMTEGGRFKYPRPRQLEGKELQEFLDNIEVNEIDLNYDENTDPDAPVYEVYMTENGKHMRTRRR